MQLAEPNRVLDPKTVAAMIVVLAFLSAVMRALARTPARGMLGALEELIGAADQALYPAKQTGRNQLLRWSERAYPTRPIPARRIALPHGWAQPN